MKKILKGILALVLAISSLTYVKAKEELAGVECSDEKVQGYYDDELQMELVARYNSMAMNEDGGSLEIVAYNESNGFAYAVSGVKAKLIAIDLNPDLNSDKVVNLQGKEYDIKAIVNDFAYGDMTSVSISEDGSKLAVAIQNEDYSANGMVAVFNCQQDGSLDYVGKGEVGVQCDNVVFVGNDLVLSADEGEPRLGEKGIDPKGSISILDLKEDEIISQTYDFTSFDQQRAELVNKGILIQKDKMPSVDFEPEYISVSDNKAYIALQEANSIAVFDLVKREYLDIYSLGLQDFGKVKVDLEKNDQIELKNYEGIYGIKMCDGISTTMINGKTYLLCANEGDSRSDWDGYDNEYENKTSLSGKYKLSSKVVWFNHQMWDGLDDSKDYVFGGRSFSMYEVTNDGLNLVFDSGSEFEEITSQVLPDYFNCSNDKISMDNRSGKKGVEAESVICGEVNGHLYAFVGLERIGGVMAYDITNPKEVKFVNYINSREFDKAIQGDVSPEGLCFIPNNHGKALLLTACEVSGTLAVYECSNKYLAYNDVHSDTWYYDVVQEVTKLGLMSYDGNNTFNPEGNITRGMIATILYRMANAPKVTYKPTFKDVKDNLWYSKAITWASEVKVVSGYHNGEFGVDDNITRQDLAIMLRNYALVKGLKVETNIDLSEFADGDEVSDYAYKAMIWCVEQGIISGSNQDNQTYLKPLANTTRSEAAKMILELNNLL